MIEIRPCLYEELPLLRKIALDAFIEKFAEYNSPENMEAYLREAYDLDTLQKEWHEERTISFMAWEKTEAVGFTRLRPNPEVEKELGQNIIELQRLYVHPFHQGKKIGSAVVQHAIDYAQQQGFEWIWLGVWEGNPQAQKFYFRMGFEKFGQHIFVMGDDPQTDWLLKKKLKP